MFARVAVLEDLQKGEGLDITKPAAHMLAVTCARVQVNGNNIIVLINRDTGSVVCGRRHWKRLFYR